MCFRSASKSGSTLVVTAAFAAALIACGSTPSAQTSAHPSTQPPSSSPAATTGGTGEAPQRSRIDRAVRTAKATYRSETSGAKLVQQLNRIARDSILTGALSRGDVAGAQAEAAAQLRSPVNHFDHVTRISVIRGSRVLVNATINSDGVFVVAPGSRALRSKGRSLGTLLVSIQDVTGYVKLVHDLTGADVVARGSSGRVRVSRGAAATASVRLPPSGHVTIAGHSYAVRSLHEIAWGNEPSANEPLTVWLLERA